MKYFFVALLLGLANAGIYMQNPRGSNNRWSSANDNVQNTRRLFRSLNDPRGGYNSGKPMYYYAGSDLEIEWTMQHGCDAEGGPEDKTNCAVILQYMCSEWVRDGMSEDTISPETANERMNGMYMYGMHETWDYYNGCMMRPRQSGLWIADRTIEGNDARYTRQNPNGDRWGFECPEERDYYPYWHPTPWRDIAIYTNRPDEMCDYYVSNSQNGIAKSWCEDMNFNTEEGCPEGMWQTGMAHGIEAPSCEMIDTARANYLGNTKTGYPHRHTWTIPTVDDDIADHCVLRIRYNVTTAEVDWNLDYQDNEDELQRGNTYFLAQGYTSPVVRDPYIPYGTRSDGSPANISFAVDTRAWGRTFQDRSHEFMIRDRPSGVSNRIHNLNVRGKRGNIVETFPAVEYDFIPDVIDMFQHEWLHIQWTGTDENTANAAGEGLDQTDRHNLVQCDSMAHHMPSDFPPEDLMFTSRQEAVRMAFGGMTYQGTLCKSLATLLQTNDNSDEVEEDELNCMKMNPGSPYFDGGLQAMRKTGTFYYMSTRNNNFTNRTQKGLVRVQNCTPNNSPPGGCPKPEYISGGEGSDSAPVKVVAASAAIAALLN